MEKHERRAKILIADDHPLIVEHLVHLLNDHVDVVGTVGDGGSLVESALSLRPDVIVTDLSMPGMNGISALRQLRAQQSDTKVIVLTMHADPFLADEALREGASGFVLKRVAGEELLTAIDEVLQGRSYVSPAVRR